MNAYPPTVPPVQEFEWLSCRLLEAAEMLGRDGRMHSLQHKYRWSVQLCCRRGAEKMTQKSLMHERGGRWHASLGVKGSYCAWHLQVCSC